MFNLDRYDDRDVITTNLLESYDRLLEFGRLHLNDNFVLDGIISVSARDKILREIISNLLAHRDFSNAYVAKMVIEKEQIYIENANLSLGFGNLELATFAPFPKNPAISKVFREIGLADELGSGMRNTYKYTQLYSGGKPQFVEGDIFRTIIPLSEANSTVTVGPTTQVATQVTTTVDNLDKDEKTEKVLAFCSVPRSRAEIMKHLELANTNHFRKTYLKPLLESGKLKMTIPDKPNSRLQKYIKGK
uniref:Fic family protein n=1 Tax=Enterocloster clostridioformis TaxID=1531 RepID=UPI002F41A8BE